MNASDPRSEAPGSTGTARRQSPRLQADDRLRISFASGSIPITLRDLSHGGFAIETRVPVMTGERQAFELGPAQGPGRPIRARAIYCRATVTGAGYVSGWKADPDEESRRTLEAAIDLLTGSREALKTDDHR
jgi:hypothetical protein